VEVVLDEAGSRWTLLVAVLRGDEQLGSGSV
jgi:hypothetical protein